MTPDKLTGRAEAYRRPPLPEEMKRAHDDAVKLGLTPMETHENAIEAFCKHLVGDKS